MEGAGILEGCWHRALVFSTYPRILFSLSVLVLLDKEITKALMRNLTNMLGISNHGSSIINLMVPLSEEQRKTVAQSRFASSKKQTVFFRICLSQSMEVVEYFLKNCSPDVDEICELSIDDDDEKTIVYVSPLWSAAHGNKIDLARILLKYGADVNLQTNRKSTPLRIACREKHVDMVKFLVANGADITAKNVDGCMCLMSGTGNAEILKYLIEIGADVNAKETGHWCATALHYAVYTEKIELVQILVDAGADMSIKDKSGHAPYACAALNTNTEMMEYLLRMNTEPVRKCDQGIRTFRFCFSGRRK
ncbi:hypothetical protein FSP39_021280 [Pinctada imbricata]|uniref:ANK_REP_REGION domain-containing protein n=1 Tax=Pinctada imbricata TaxID=66713 RepID=A0AA88YPA9_PINIB|nr:hypothetical protein FSP39_021280 [Pinctada imbricata]